MAPVDVGEDAVLVLEIAEHRLRRRGGRRRSSSCRRCGGRCGWRSGCSGAERLQDAASSNHAGRCGPPPLAGATRPQRASACEESGPAAVDGCRMLADVSHTAVASGPRSMQGPWQASTKLPCALLSRCVVPATEIELTPSAGSQAARMRRPPDRRHSGQQRCRSGAAWSPNRGCRDCWGKRGCRCLQRCEWNCA